MKITTFLSVNNENLGAIARIVYKGVQVAPKQEFQKYVWVTIVLRSTLEIQGLIWVYTVYKGLSVSVLRVIMVPSVWPLSI